MKHIFIIGKTGQLGRALLSDAPRFGFTVDAVGRDELEVTNADELAAVISRSRPDILINTSAFHVVPACEEYPEKAFSVNAAAVYRMAKLCKEKGITFVTYTTDYVFDGKKGVPLTEDEAICPIQIYGISRAAAELAVSAAYSEGSYIIRTSALYGGEAGSRSKGGNFVLDRIKEAAGKKAIEVASEQIINPTYADDLSVATLKLIASEAPSGIYHLVNEGYCSWAEFAAETFRAAGIKTAVIPRDRGGRSGDMRRPKFSALANTKAKALGVILPTWQEGLASYIKFLRSKKVL